MRDRKQAEYASGSDQRDMREREKKDVKINRTKQGKEWKESWKEERRHDDLH